MEFKRNFLIDHDIGNDDVIIMVGYALNGYKS